MVRVRDGDIEREGAYQLDLRLAGFCERMRWEGEGDEVLEDHGAVECEGVVLDGDRGCFDVDLTACA